MLGRLVVVIGEARADGCRRLLAAGARRVFVIGGGVGAEPGIEVHPARETLPLRDASVDVVSISSEEIPRVSVAEIRRVLRQGGTLAVYLERADPQAQADVAAALAPSFAAIEWLALSPWQGLTIAPIAGEGGDREAPRQAIFSDDLLAAAPRPVALLALASAEPRPREEECVLLALPQGDQPVAPILNHADAPRVEVAAPLEAATSEAAASSNSSFDPRRRILPAVEPEVEVAPEQEPARARPGDSEREAAVAAREAALDERERQLTRRAGELRGLERSLGEREALIIAAETGKRGPRGAAKPEESGEENASEEVVALRKKVASLTIRA
ncbi:MAG: hypothetical protein KC486_34145, partial [Myxococcales bacterium]|nr:hypothetical protein [Myxococcales bacterium]